MAKTPVSTTPLASLTEADMPKARKARELTPEGAARLEAARGKDRVPVADFVHAWCNKPTIAAIAAELGLTAQAVTARAKTLCKIGTRLPERLSGAVRGGGAGGRGRVGYSAHTVEELNAIIAAAEAGTLGLDANGKLSLGEVESDGSAVEPEADDIL